MSKNSLTSKDGEILEVKKSSKKHLLVLVFANAGKSSSVFPLNVKMQICKNMSGGFAVIIEQCMKTVQLVFVNFFSLLEFLQFC